MLMRALTYDRSSGAFAVREVPRPEPGPDDLLVKVEACGLNPVDAKIGLWIGSIPDRGDFVPGLDVSGVVEAVGKNVSRWKRGDRVLYHGNRTRPDGGFAEYALQDSAAAIAHPNVSAAIAAATPCAGWTAWRALVDKLHATASDSLLVIGGSGGVGSFAVQIARHLGLTTVIATCSAANVEYVKSLGATHAIDYASADPVAAVMEITNGRGVTLAIDTVGANNDISAANSLAFDGQMVELVDVVRPARYREPFGRGLTFHQISLGSAGYRGGPAGMAALVAAGSSFSSLLESGAIRPPALRTIPIDATGPALVEMLGQRTRGKIVMVM